MKRRKSSHLRRKSRPLMACGKSQGKRSRGKRSKKRRILSRIHWKEKIRTKCHICELLSWTEREVLTAAKAAKKRYDRFPTAISPLVYEEKYSQFGVIWNVA